MILNLKKEIFNPTFRWMRKVLNYTTLWNTLIFIFIGGFSYFCLGD